MAGSGLPSCCGEAFHKRRDQRRNVFLPFPQRRQLDLKSVQPVIEIGAEPILRQRLMHRPIGRRDDAEIGLQRFRAAERAKFALLQDAQKTRLQFRRHLGNLIEEKRASFGFRDHPAEIVHRAGKRAFHVTKQLRLDHRLRKGGAVQFHHRLLRPTAAVVDHIRDHFLAHAALAGDEHVRFRRRHRR